MSEVENTKTEIGAKPEKKRKRMGLIILAVILVIAAGGICWWNQVLRTTIKTDNAKVTGDIVDISPKVSGRLDVILVKEQQPVKKGQVLARLDSEPLKIALAQAEGTLAQYQANYDKLPDDLKAALAAVDKAQEGVAAEESKVQYYQTSLDDANRILAENQKLFEAGALSQETLDSTKSKVDTARALLEAEQANLGVAQAAVEDAAAKNDAANRTSAALYLAQLKSAKAGVDNARYNLRNSEIKAPSDGIVLRVVIQQGENVTAGQTVISVCDLSETWVNANIEEKKIARVKAGQKVDIRIDSYPGKVIHGRVEAVGNAAQSVFSLISSESTSGNYTKVAQRLTVRIKPLDRKLVLKPGMSAQIKIYTPK
ncbi:MAG: HlyD family secretion protein [Deltaproteobacteria bacterium]